MQPEDKPYVRITLDVIYDQLCQVRSKVDSLADMVEDIKDHESRIRDIEKQRAPIVAGLAMLLAVAIPVAEFLMTRGV